MARNTTITARDGAEATRPPFNFENMPNSFRYWNEEELQEANLALARFLREAVCGLVARFNEKGFPNHGGDDFAVRGMEAVFDLLIDRMEIVAGRSPMPLLRDVPDRGAGAD